MIWTIIMANILLLCLIWIGKEMTSKLRKELTKLISIKILIKKEGVHSRHNCTRRAGRIHIRRSSPRPLSRRRTRVNLERKTSPPNYNDLETEISEACRLLNRNLTKQGME